MPGPERDRREGELLYAPWSPQTVQALTAFQDSARMHPFTCGGPHPELAARAEQRPVLRAAEDGWHCPDQGCGYTQPWAHAFMASAHWSATPRRTNPS